MKLKDMLTIPRANGHPTPDHYGNMRGGIPHPKNNRVAYRRLLELASDMPYYLVERRLPPLLPRLERVEQPAPSSVILHDQAPHIMVYSNGATF
jgi:hypothetical protein